MDAQARLGSVCGLAALVHGLVIAAAEPDERRPRSRRARCSSSRRSAPAATGSTRRSGTTASLQPLRELAAAAIERARPARAQAVGAEAALEEVERILRDGNGAQRMRAAHAEGGMARVLERLVAESAEPLEVG